MGGGAGVKSVVFAFWFCHLAGAQAPESLRVGTPIERAIRPKEIHRYPLHLDAGQLLHLTARQSGADIVLSLNGTPVTSADELREMVRKSGKHIALLIQREGRQLFVPIELG